MASAGNPCNQKSQNASVPACSSKPPYLPWGGHGSATITVSDGQPCGVGWHDTPGGPGGVTVLDSMSVSSPPSHGTLRPQDQHVIIFTPAPNYKGQDTFTLTMREHNGGRSATLSVTVSVTIQ
jgi:Bacterial Ig domain